MRKTRPVNLNLLAFHFPVTAISSILHRISGVILFFFIVLMLWALDTSLQSPISFDSLKNELANNLGARFLVWIFLSSLLFHFLAGVRHLLMDLGIGEDIRGGRFGAYLVIILSVVFTLILGVRLW